MKYFLLQLKRLARAVPMILTVSYLLACVILMILSQFSAAFKNDQAAKFTVAIVGSTTSRMFDFGISALTAADSSRFSIDIQQTDEQTARKRLLDGDISAYVVIPKEFSKYARQGKTIPLTYCTTASTIDISGLMRDEITKVISIVLKQSQKGVFGEKELLIGNGYADMAELKADDISFEYLDFILDRDKMYKTRITGVSYGLDLTEHLMVGQSILFVFILTIPFSCMLMRRDNGLIRLLSAAGKGPLYSALTEYAALFCAYLCTLILLVLAVFLSNRFLHFDLISEILTHPARIALCFLPVVAMACAFAFAMEEISGNILSNVTGSFFLSMGLCYISGCMYPLYVLPPILQKAASFTPTGAARALISLSVVGNNSRAALCTVAAYTLLFLALATLARSRKLSRGDAV